MAVVSVSYDRDIGASAERVYRILRDYWNHHPHILPPAFTSFAVEEGGIGTGTVIRFSVRTGGRTQHFHQRIEETTPGRVLREVDIDGDLATTFVVTPAGETCRVRIETTWPTKGIRGVIERILSPRLLIPIYTEELANLDRYAREHPEV
ncbi:MAG TPA: SRPBCC family protein [Thermomicrobiales bacterium]|nr:SRPBCC family protein [Thermomicrobiales bacterium]